MIKPFGIKKTDWEVFNRNLFDQCIKIQNNGGKIIDMKYSSIEKYDINQVPNKIRVVEYSVIIIYEDNS